MLPVRKVLAEMIKLKILRGETDPGFSKWSNEMTRVLIRKGQDRQGKTFHIMKEAEDGKEIGMCEQDSHDTSRKGPESRNG